MREQKRFANYYRQSGNRPQNSFQLQNLSQRQQKQAKELQVLQEENDRLRNEIKVLQEYKEKAHRELCRVRDEQKTFGKIKVKTEFNL